ncbi:MAG: class IV adenylate cyclase [Terriglobales bacterium]
MPRNLEIKAALRDRAAAMAVAARLADSGPEVTFQEDVFFPCEDARLKLRTVHSSSGAAPQGELIRYRRDDLAEVRCSNYSIARTPDPQILRDILSGTLGVIGIIKKTRTLYLAGQTRIHIDRVEGLGDFLEFEVVLRENQSEDDGKHIAKHLLADFGIDARDLIAEAYVDLLRLKRVSSSQLHSPK